MMFLDVLIIYEPVSQESMINRLLEEMNKKGLNMDAFNMHKLQFHINRKKSLIYKFLSFLQHFFLLRLFIKRFFYSSILHKLSLKTKLIDIHFFSRNYVRFLEHYNSPYKLTIWGSDFNRELPYWQERKREIYKRASIIQVATKEMKNSLLSYEKSLVNKIQVCNFGVSLLTQIEEFRSFVNIDSLKKDRIVITCGYNGTKGQQHLKIFNAISHLPKKLKEKLYLQIPLTYGLSRKYRKNIKSALALLNCPYKLYLSRLSDNDLAKLRLRTDITINMQITDALSASLIEHLYSGNILIVGDWLPYGLFDEAKVFYLKSSIEELPSVLECAINDIDNNKLNAKDNLHIIESLFSWSSVSLKQANLYKSLAS